MPSNQRTPWGFFKQGDARAIFAAQVSVILVASVAAAWVAGAPVPTETRLETAAAKASEDACRAAADAVGASIALSSDGTLTVQGRQRTSLSASALESSLVQARCPGHALVSACAGTSCESPATGFVLQLKPSATHAASQTGGGA